MNIRIKSVNSQVLNIMGPSYKDVVLASILSAQGSQLPIIGTNTSASLQIQGVSIKVRFCFPILLISNLKNKI